MMRERELIEEMLALIRDLSRPGGITLGERIADTIAKAEEALTPSTQNSPNHKAERDELSADLAAIRQATRVRPSKKAIAYLKDLLETMEAMGEKEAPGLSVLLELNDKLDAL